MTQKLPKFVSGHLESHLRHTYLFLGENKGVTLFFAVLSQISGFHSGCHPECDMARRHKSFRKFSVRWRTKFSVKLSSRSRSLFYKYLGLKGLNLYGPEMDLYLSLTTNFRLAFFSEGLLNF